MEAVRKSNNDIKRSIIQDACDGIRGAQVLDVGCGFGGDLKKWSQWGARIDMCDPDAAALEEAKSRAKSMNMNVKFFHGDIRSCPNKKYDVICFNFSLHYIFESRDLFHQSLKSIRSRLKKGGVLVGCIPDATRIIMNTPYKDSHGNLFIRKEGTGLGNFGERQFVQLSDTPFYRNGPRPEPLAYKDLLVTYLENKGVILDKWEQFGYEHEIQKMYSIFKFVVL